MNQDKEFKKLILDYAKCKGYDNIIEALESVRGDDYIPYYHDINKLYDEYEEYFWDMFTEYCEEIGQPPLETLNNMNMRYSNGQHITDLQSVKQWIVWFAVEHVAYELARELEEKEEQQL